MKYWLNGGTFKFFITRDSIPMPLLGSKCTEIAGVTELFRIHQ